MPERADAKRQARDAEAAAQLQAMDKLRRSAGLQSVLDRTVHCMDAVAYLNSVDVLPGDVVTSLPDVSELKCFNTTPDEWQRWFVDTAELILQKLPADRFVVFLQTDVKVLGKGPEPGDGPPAPAGSACVVREWVDKSFLCSLAAHRAGARMMWHKIELLDDTGRRGAGRPCYSHALCYSRAATYPLELETDVHPRGPMAWSRAIGMGTCTRAIRFLLRAGGAVVVDPFCGTGTVLAVANFFGLRAIGVELSPRRARASRRNTVESLMRLASPFRAESPAHEGEPVGRSEEVINAAESCTSSDSEG
eukprot:EG_transcript_17853